MFSVIISALSTTQGQLRYDKDAPALLSDRVIAIEEVKDTALEYTTVQLNRPDAEC